ncbi:unnamed protein product [Auanema sp. JU1783]|nr:unnamed protein product [Auanema sp. JU1783]
MRLYRGGVYGDMAILNVLGFLTLGLVYGLYNTHNLIHEKNDCGMTYMWRPITFHSILKDSADTGYSLLKYCEGTIRKNTLPEDVAVLFIPGSGGSFQQVRSVASVMMNKTDMYKYPYKLQFFTIDFDEEHSILSGKILYQQRAFVNEAVSFLKTVHSRCKYKKVILIGHSVGGVLAYSLPAISNFDTNTFDLIITLAAPLAAPPVYIDSPMSEFYDEMHNAWNVKKKELAQVGILSYSGGEKDFLVPDHLTNISRVAHLPSWAIETVNMPIDHLCILWCNQLTRHVTRSLSAYMDAKRKNERTSATEIVRQIKKKEMASFPKGLSGQLALERKKLENSTFIDHLSVYKNGLKMEKGVEVVSLIHLNTTLMFSVEITLNPTCPLNINYSVIYPNGFRRISYFTNHSLRAWFWSKEGKADYGISLMVGKAPCQYDLYLVVDIFRTWYRTSLMHTNTILSGLIYTSCVLVLIEASRIFSTVQARISHGIWFSMCVMSAGALSLYYNTKIEEYIIFSSCVFAFVACRMIFRFPFWLIVHLPASIIRVYQAILLSLACIIATLNPYLASLCVCLTSVMVVKLQNTQSLNTLCLAGLCAVVNGAIGLSAVYRKQTIENINNLPAIPNIDRVSRSLPVFLFILFKSRIGARISNFLYQSFGPRLSKITICMLIISYGYNNWIVTTKTLDDAAFAGSMILGVLQLLNN